ncbi:hypothetical protein [Spirosoma sp.]|uniref:hypothetical protein n=1 Tax=Spirosoma sp. TaxID=1899569 RepID=UPI003B3B7DC9
MMSKITGFILTFCLITGVVSGQNTRTTQAKKVQATPSKPVSYSLNPQDYKYYVLVERTASSQFSDSYFNSVGRTPVPLSAKRNLPSEILILNVNDMREVAWWPQMKTYRKDDKLYIREGGNNTGQGEWIASTTETGKIIYQNYLTSQLTGPLKSTGSLLSEDWKHTYFVNNGDVWVGDFNLVANKITNERQITSSGIIQKIKPSYMRDNALLIGQYNIDINTKHVVETGYFEVPPIDSSPFYVTFDRGLSSFKIFNMNTQEMVHELPQPNIHTFWLDKEQTRYLRYKKYPNLTREQRKTETPEQRKTRQETEKRYRFEIYDVSKKTETVVDWQNIDFEIFGNGSLSMNKLTLTRSPSGLRFWGSFTNDLAAVNLKSNGSFFIHDIKTLKEEPLINDSAPGWENIFWTDDNHLIFTAKEGSIVNGNQVTAMTQGTYIIDINTKEIKKLTPYLLSSSQKTVESADPYKNFIIRLPEANLIVFEANQYLFSCHSDGSDVKQLTKYPGIYSLRQPFLDKTIN